MKKWWGIIIFLIAFIAVGAVLYINKPEETLTYKILEVKRGNIENIVSGIGRLTASKEQKEYSRALAEVSEIYYVEGDTIEEGWPIIKLDSSSYDFKIKSQEIAIKQAELSKANIENQINNLKLIAENDGYVSGLTIDKESYVTNNMAICNVIESGKFEVVLQFVYYENYPIIVGTLANVTLPDSFSSLVGTVTKVSDMPKLIEGNAQVIDVTIEVETTGYSLDGASARAELSNGLTIIQSVNSNVFKSVKSSVIRAKTSGTVKEIYVSEGKRIKAGDTIALLENSDLETNLQDINLTLENLNNQLDILKNNLKNYLIYASISGKITNQKVKVGDMVEVGTLLTTITNKENMNLVVPINEVDITKLSYYKEVRVIIDALSETKDNPLVGKIIDISHEGVTDDENIEYYVTIQIKGNENIKISMKANADIVIESAKDVLYIPKYVLINENGKNYVDVLKSDGITIERKEVIIGVSDRANVEIKSGLEEGEKVIMQ